MSDSDIYRMDGPTDFDASDSSSGDEFIQQLPGDDSENDMIDFHEHPSPKLPLAQDRRPPAISTSWNDFIDSRSGAGVDRSGDDEEARFGAPSTDAARVSFNVPQSSRYPVQNLRNDPKQSMRRNRQQQHQTPAARKVVSTPGTEETPAFIRQYARDVMKRADYHNLATNPHKHDVMVPPPPNSLAMVREKEPNTRKMEHASPSNIGAFHDTSFYGADASALDGTFVSIRDLNDDNDDVPSIDNEQDLYGGAKYSDARFPTETTSLLGRNRMSWQGGFFGSQVEKEDRRERRKIMRDRNGRLAGWVWSIHSIMGEIWGSDVKSNIHSRMLWEANHPIGVEMPVRSYATTHAATRRPVFSVILIGCLCFHMMLCGLHDLFVRYVAYRNGDEVGASWDGEGIYYPPYWLSFEGRVLNPCIGPGSRTLTAFGSLVPGIVLTKGQWWRLGLSLLQSSSLLELLLHSFALKTAIGGSLVGLEWRRGTFAVSLFYVITAVVGSAWSMAVEKGRLVTSSGMGVSGILAAAIVEQYCFPLALKDEEDDSPSTGGQIGSGSGGPNAISSTSNEQFSFEPIQQKKDRNLPINSSNPLLLLLMEALSSWCAPYSSLAGTVTSAAMGLALSLVMFVGRIPEQSIEFDNQDLVFKETPPPPPTQSTGMWRDDDDSADSSFGSARQAFQTPLMRKSILADDEDEDDQPGAKSMLRKRKSSAPDLTKTPAIKGRVIAINPNKSKQSVTTVLWRIIGIFIALLLTLIPSSLIAAGEDPSFELTRASIMGCKPMRIVYKQDASDAFQCAGGCVPLSRTKVAEHKEGMRDGRCDSIGFRCDAGEGTMILKSYELNVGLYVITSSDGSCAVIDEDSSFNGEANEEEKA